MPSVEFTISTESESDRDFMDDMHKGSAKMGTSAHVVQAPQGQVAVPPASRYFETRERWRVSYEGDGIRATGHVLGFSEAGWHIVGDRPVLTGARLILWVHRPDGGGFCVPSATVQGVQGRAFVIRVQLPVAC